MDPGCVDMGGVDMGCVDPGGVDMGGVDMGGVDMGCGHRLHSVPVVMRCHLRLQTHVSLGSGSSKTRSRARPTLPPALLQWQTLQSIQGHAELLRLKAVMAWELCLTVPCRNYSVFITLCSSITLLCSNLNLHV